MTTVRFGRREAMFGAVLGAALAGTAPPARAAARDLGLLPAQRRWEPVPPQVPVVEGMAQAAGARLYCWDTGGPGEPIVLLHPITGSALIWGYQQPVFARAGYRVIAWSRRGHARSDLGDPNAPGTAVDDLKAVLDHLKVDRCHLVGTAGGAFFVPDFALSHPDRLLSMAVTCSQGGVTEPAYRQSIARLTPQGFANMPQSFRELGPSYRLANPSGVAEWEALEHAALSGPAAIRPPPKNRLNFEDLARIRTPTLVLSGAADLYAPPALMLQLAEQIAGAEFGVLSECGHSGYWEQPLAFNAAVLAFVGRHGRAGR